MAHSNASASEVQYHVFLSFCGADTHFDFTDFLNRDLNNARIRVFKIGETILQAINNSKICIPIISRTYPDREWCLIQLEHMMYNVFRSNGKKRTFSIFYKVEPGVVKHRTPCPKNLSSEVELRAFKEALAKVGQIKRWKVEEQQSQAKIVDLVVRKVLEELGKKDESQIEDPIELDDLIESLEDSYNRTVMSLDRIKMSAFGRYKCSILDMQARLLLDTLGKGIESALVYPRALVAEPWQASSEMFPGIDPRRRYAMINFGS